MSLLDNIYKKLPFLGQPPTITSGQKQEQTPVPEATREIERVTEPAAVRIPKRAVDAQGNERARPLEKCEDTTYADDHFAVTADGVGGAGSGEIASTLAVEAAVQALKKEEANGIRGAELMKKVMEAAASEVLGDRHLHPERGHMNTTFTAVLLEQGRSGTIDGTLGHVGDSRAYLFRPETGALEKLSRDDSILTFLSEPDLGPLTEEQQQFLSAVFEEAPLSTRRPETRQLAAFLDQTEHKGADVPLPSPQEFIDEAFRYYGLLDRLMEQLSEREEFPAQRPDQQTTAELTERLQRLQRSLSGVLNDLVQLRESGATTGEILFRLRNIIDQALVTAPNGASEYHLSTFEARPGDVVFTISDGIGDVLTEVRIQQLFSDGLKANKSTQEIFEQIAAAARSDLSARQKGKVIKKDAEGNPLLLEGDDIGIAGLHVFEKAEAAASSEHEEAVQKETRFTSEQIVRWREDLREAASGSFDEMVAQTLLAKALAQNPEFAHFDLEDGDVVYEKFAGKMVPLRLAKDRGNEVMLAVLREESGVPFVSKVVSKSELGRLFQQTLEVKDGQYRKGEEDLLTQASAAAKRQAK